MPDDEVSVTLGVGSAPYQKTLIPALLRAGMVRRVFGSGPFLDVSDPSPDGSLQLVKRFPLQRFVKRLCWAIWRRVPASVRPTAPVMVTVHLADWTWSQWIPPCKVFHQWMGYSLASLKVAKRHGTVTLLENPGSHARNWLEAGVEECRRYGMDPRKRFQAMTLPQVLRIEEEYQLCDRIIVPSRFSYRTFVEFGLAEKAIIVLPGVDTELFAPSAEAKNRDLFRVCFVGRIELAKGMGYLLEAWKRLNLPNAELVLVGEVKPEMKSIFEKFGSSNIRTTGMMTVGRVAECYRNSDLFVLPSVNEGLAQVLLEAMSSGLAVVASDRSGAEDCVTDGKEGFVVPARDVEKLADRVFWCYQHREETRAMGSAARARIESAFTLDHYNARQMAVYRDIGLEDRDSVR